jgi:hypothetical protein
MNNDILLGWTASGTPVHLDDIQANPLALRELHHATPAGATALLVVHAVAPRFFDGAPIRRAGDGQHNEIHQGRTIQ